jgi:NAD(P)H-dependent FMN reductase
MAPDAASLERDPMPTTLSLALIYGSVRPGRLCDAVAGWAAAEIRRDGGWAVDLIDPAAPDFPADDAELRRRIDRADCAVVVTPEYNGSFPAPLKALIDSVHDEWRAKPVAFVSYGGRSGGLRAVEQLRLVFGELDAVAIRDGVSFQQAWDAFGPGGELIDAARPRRAAARMLARLHWWTVALKAARDADLGREVAA